MRRLGLGFVDQGVSSAVQALLLFAVAHVADVHTLGEFTLVVLVLTIVIASTRGLLGTPIALLAHDRGRLRTETAHAQVAALVLGLLATAAALAGWAGFGLGTWAGWIAVAAPIVVVQDTLRFHATAASRPGAALASDTVWALGTMGALVGTWTGDIRSVATVVAIWAGAAALALVLLLAWCAVAPRWREPRTWLLADLPGRLRYAGEGFLAAATTTVVLFLAALLIGVDASAALRAAAALFAPMVIFLQAIPLVVVPELRRRGRIAAADSWPVIVPLASAASAVALVTGAVLWASPWGLGPLLLGRSWHITRPLIPVTGANYACVAWMQAVGGGLRARDDARGLLRNRTLFTSVSVVLGVLAAAWPGTALAVAIALAVAAGIAAAGAVRRLFTPAG